jgi:tetratricopeptide (TPR) repeat protein
MLIDQKAIKGEMNQLIEVRDFNGMIEKAGSIIDEHPSSYLGRWWMSRALTFMRRTDEALDWLMMAMRRADSDGEESRIASSMANVYNVRKQWEDSLNYSAISLELDPRNVVGVIARSIALSATGKRNEASRLLDSNKRLYVDDYQRACVAAVKRDKPSMLEYLRNAMEGSPHSKVTVRYDPDFALYRRDPEFREITA